jgi:hypothetical protein
MCLFWYHNKTMTESTANLGAGSSRRAEIAWFVRPSLFVVGLDDPLAPKKGTGSQSVWQ